MFRSLVTILTVLWFYGTEATASPIQFDFIIDLDSAPDGSGNFVIDTDQLTGVGLEIFSPDNATRTLLSFSAMVGGLLYTESDDTDFPSFPDVSFEDGIVTGIGFVGEIGTQCLNIGTGSAFDVAFVDLSLSTFTCGEPLPISGQITDISPALVTPVPAPAALPLFAAGLVGLGLMRRRRLFTPKTIGRLSSLNA